MWIISLILVSFLGLVEGNSSFITLLRRTAREISMDKFDGLCASIGCRPPGGHCDYFVFKQEGKIQCTCNKNYTGDLCQHKCTIDCGEYGKCVLEGDRETCKCAHGYTGVNCSERDSLSLFTQQIMQENKAHSVVHQTDPEGGCSPQILKYNFPCNIDHGVCIKNTTDFGFIYSCVCKEGWIGTFCDTPCNKKCQNGGFCHVMSSGARAGEQVCICKWNNTGEFCEKPKPYQIFINKSTKRTKNWKKKSTIELVKTKSSADKAIQEKTSANHISRRSIGSQSSCHSICGYNSERCTSIDLALPYRIKTYYICDCKPGWTGTQCQHKCSLPCQNGGQCIINHGEEFCACNMEYNGHLCEIPSAHIK